MVKMGLPPFFSRNNLVALFGFLEAKRPFYQ